MPRIDDVYRLLRQGKTTFEIMDELHIGTGRLEEILASKRIRKLETLHREAVAMAAKAVSAQSALAIPKKLAELAGDDSPRAVKACEALLKQLNLNYPPAAKTRMRSSFWD